MITGHASHQVGLDADLWRKRRQQIVLIFRIPILDRHVLAIDIAGFLETPEKWNGVVLVVIVSGLSAEVPNHWTAGCCASSRSAFSIIRRCSRRARGMEVFFISSSIHVRTHSL
jgi:hypothetical protein